MLAQISRVMSGRGGFGRGGGRGGGFRSPRGGRGGGRDFGGRGFGRGRGDFGPPASVVEVGVFKHPCEGELVCKLTNEGVRLGLQALLSYSKQAEGT